MRPLALGCLLALGCSTPASEIGAPLPAARVAASLSAWEAHGNASGQCAARVQNVRVLVTTPDEVTDRCQTAVQACTIDDLIVVSEESMSVYALLLEHELRHWLGSCAYNLPDAPHRNAQFWYGGVSVEEIWAQE